MMMNPDSNPSTVVPRKYHDKEVFVTGHAGTTYLEIFLLCLVIPFGLELYYSLHARWFRQQQQPLGNNHNNNNNNSNSCRWKSMKVLEIILEFATLVMPMLLVQTSVLPETTGQNSKLIRMD